MKRYIFLLLKKLKINKEYLLNFYVKNKLKLDFKNNSYMTTSITNIVEFEKFIDSIVNYINYKELGFLYNLNDIKKEKEKIRVIDLFTLDGYYLSNVDEINIRILNKILDIKTKIKQIDEYHSRNLKSHIILLEDYLSIVL
jgi:hypothetical protein